MYRILKKRKLAEKIWLMDIQADRIAGKCLPGEFLIVKIDKQGERVPLTICDYNRETGVITIVFQERRRWSFPFSLASRRTVVGAFSQQTREQRYPVPRASLKYWQFSHRMVKDVDTYRQ